MDDLHVEPSAEEREALDVLREIATDESEPSDLRVTAARDFTLATEGNRVRKMTARAEAERHRELADELRAIRELLERAVG